MGNLGYAILEFEAAYRGAQRKNKAPARRDTGQAWLRSL